MPWRFCVWDRLKSYSARKYKTHMNAVSILRAWQEEGSILRNVIGGDQSVNGRQSLNKLLCWQLHGQEAAKLNQRVLTLKKAELFLHQCVPTLKTQHNTACPGAKKYNTIIYAPVCPDTENTTQYFYTPACPDTNNTLYTSMFRHQQYNTLYTNLFWQWL